MWEKRFIYMSAHTIAIIWHSRMISTLCMGSEPYGICRTDTCVYCCFAKFVAAVDYDKGWNNSTGYGNGWAIHEIFSSLSLHQSWFLSILSVQRPIAMPPLSEAHYLCDIYIAAVWDYHSYLMEMCFDKYQVLEPPEGDLAEHNSSKSTWIRQNERIRRFNAILPIH